MPKEWRRRLYLAQVTTFLPLHSQPYENQLTKNSKCCTIRGGGIALSACEQLPVARNLPQPAPVATAAPAAQPYTPAQQAWLNFVDKVRRGEQLDPTGQYVKDGTAPAATSGPASRTAAPTYRPKLDAARDKYPFVLRPDGSYVLLGNGQGASANYTAPPDNPQPLPCTDCVGQPGSPTVTSTFVSSVGQGGNGAILDMKVTITTPTMPGYVKINSDLNKGAGGSYIYYWFTRTPNSVMRGIEYEKPPYYSANQGLTAYRTDEGSALGGPPKQSYVFWPIWQPTQNSNVDWNELDVNAGAGGKYIYTYYSKTNTTQTTTDKPFKEIGILSGNSDQIQPPNGWVRYNSDLNSGAGGDYIYLCYHL